MCVFIFVLIAIVTNVVDAFIVIPIIILANSGVSNAFVAVVFLVAAVVHTCI